jgi:hypothetical protein
MMFHEDGCVVPNIELHEYVLKFAPVCDHSKFRSAEINVMAPSPESARRRGTELVPFMKLALVEVVPV